MVGPQVRLVLLWGDCRVGWEEGGLPEGTEEGGGAAEEEATLVAGEAVEVNM